MEILDECYRCGYDLRGMADDHPCPECGLIAGRSRRPTDELHHSRPRWLRRLAIGAWLMLVGLAAMALWPSQISHVQDWIVRVTSVPVMPPGNRPRRAAQWRMPPWASTLHDSVPAMGFVPIGLVLVIATWLLSGPEGYPPADRADRRRRIALRLLPGVLFILPPWTLLPPQLLPSPLRSAFQERLTALVWIAVVTLGSAGLLLLLAARFRNLARRARSAHLAEHCMIVGIGGSLSLVLVVGLAIYNSVASDGMPDTSNSRILRGMAILFVLLILLFLIWSGYLLLRFAIAFSRASWKLRMQWRQSDRAAGVG